MTSGAVRPVSRRDLTRAAIFAGAALMVDGCGGADAETPPPDDDTTSGGDDGTSGHTTYDGVWTADADAGVDAGAPDAGVDAGNELVVDPDFEDPRRRRQLPRCVYEGTCPAPPYGAPPADVTLV